MLSRKQILAGFLLLTSVSLVSFYFTEVFCDGEVKKPQLMREEVVEVLEKYFNPYYDFPEHLLSSSN